MVVRHPLSWRSRWLRGVLLLMVVMVGLRLGWGAHSERRLSGQLSVIRARGEPGALAEVKFEAVADSENAWLVLLRAAGSHVAGVDSPANSVLEYRDVPPYPAAWKRMAEASEKAHGGVFALARQARGMPRARLRTGLTSAANVVVPGWSSARQLANTVGDGALWSHLQGDDVEAIERVRDVLHVARCVRQDEVMVSQLVGIGLDALGCHRAQVIAPGLRAPEGSEARRRALELIGELLEESDEWRGFGRSIMTERLVALDDLHTRSREQWVIRPLADLSGVRLNENIDVALEAARFRSKPEVNAVLARSRVEKMDAHLWRPVFGSGSDKEVPRYSRWYVIWPGDLSRYFETQFRVISDRRATAVSLAIQLYRADHGGWPARLDELVPKYLETLPADPYRVDGRSIGYEMRTLPGGAVRPMLYIDVGPGEVEVRDEPLYGYNQTRGKDGKWNEKLRQYRDVSRFRPAPAAVPRAPARGSVPKGVEEDVDEAGAPGKQADEDDRGDQP